MEKEVLIKVYGKVQGVGFRFTAHLGFVDLGITGSAENMPDGSVHIRAKGPEDKIERLIKWCHKGPEGARVTNVEVQNIAGVQTSENQE